MPDWCCVPGCSATYKTANVFRFPLNKLMWHKWAKAIPGKKFDEYKRYYICSRHFLADQIIREDILDNDGNVKRERCSLRPDAIPSQFLHSTAYTLFDIETDIKNDGSRQSSEIIANMTDSKCLLGCQQMDNEPVFNFPGYSPERRKWIDAILPELVLPDNEEYYLCKKHFQEKDIRVKRRVEYVDGNPLPVKTERLRHGAIPSLHLDVSNLRLDLNVRIKSLDEIAQNVGHVQAKSETRKSLPVKTERNRQRPVRSLHLDVPNLRLNPKYRIKSLDEIVQNMEYMPSKSDLWNYVEMENRILFYKLNLKSRVPCIERSFNVNSDFSVDLFVDGRKLETSLVRRILGAKLECDLFPKLDKLMDFMENLKLTEIDLRHTVTHDLNKIIDKSPQFGVM